MGDVDNKREANDGASCHIRLIFPLIVPAFSGAAWRDWRPGCSCFCWSRACARRCTSGAAIITIRRIRPPRPAWFSRLRKASRRPRSRRFSRFRSIPWFSRSARVASGSGSWLRRGGTRPRAGRPRRFDGSPRIGVGRAETRRPVFSQTGRRARDWPGYSRRNVPVATHAQPCLFSKSAI